MSSHSALQRRPSTSTATSTIAAGRPCGSWARSPLQSRRSTIVRPRDQVPVSSTRTGSGSVVSASGATTAHTAPASPTVASCVPKRSHWCSTSRPASSAAPPRRDQLLRLLAGDPDVVEDVEAVHRHRHAQLGRALQDDGGRLGVVPDVELGRGGGVADVGRAAHEHDPPQPGRRLGPGPQQQRDVRQRRQRHQRDAVVLPAGGRLDQHVAQQLHGVPRVGPGWARGRPRSPMPSSPWTCRASSPAPAAAGRRRGPPARPACRPPPARSGCWPRRRPRRRCRPRRSPPRRSRPGCRAASSSAHASSTPVSTSSTTGRGRGVMRPTLAARPS